MWKGESLPEGSWFAKHSLMSLAQAKQYAESLMESIRESEPVEGTKYRGMSFDLSADLDINLFTPFSKLKAGDVFDLPLSSFTTGKNVTNTFMSSHPEMTNVLLELEGSHKGLNLSPFNHFREKEFITSGAFEVTDIRRITGTDLGYASSRPMLHIKIKQRNTW
jgi:hypothetical protein